MSRETYEAEAWLQILPGWAKAPAVGSARVVGCTQAEPTKVVDGARVVKVRLVIPAVILDPVPVTVTLDVPSPDTPVVAGTATVTS